MLMSTASLSSSRSGSLRPLALAVAAILTGASLMAQPPSDPNYQPPKTPWGDPDLQGIWPGELRAPLQRPKDLGERLYLTPEEYDSRQEQRDQQALADNEEFAGERAGEVSISPPSYWTERGTPSLQTSLIVDPLDGQLPALTQTGKERTENTPAEWRGIADKPSDLSLYYRCITRGLIGTTLPSAYDNGNRIMQAPGYVVIQQEMIHEHRVIPLDGRAPVDGDIQLYLGDSRGHWEGNTLVVVTKNFTDRTSIGGNGVAYNGQGGRNSDALTVTERFTRTSADTLKYEATIDDPVTWERPWTISIPFQRDPGYQMFEYACHEGNYAMRDILMGARLEEQLAKSGGER